MVVICCPILRTTEDWIKHTIKFMCKIAKKLEFPPMMLGIESQSGGDLNKRFEMLGSDLIGRSVVWLIVFFRFVFFHYYLALATDACSLIRVGFYHMAFSG